jgi:hypothetical protein
MTSRFSAICLIAFTLFHFSLSAQEICNHAIDDDLDGLIDLNDTSDCVCHLAKAPGHPPGCIIICTLQKT